ncbi:MAG: hypothetical protein QXF45_03455 [Candidatus Caldarchaeum sp.]
MVESKWASRFIAAGIVQGALATGLTFFWLVAQFGGFLKPEFTRVIAFGSAGMYFTIGYTTYLIVGVVAVAVSALFYNYLEVTLGKPYKGIAEKFAWLHFILMNVGVVGATWLLMVVGYLGGAALLPPEVGGLGWSPGRVHTEIFFGILPFGIAMWIVAFLFVTVAGVVFGGLGYILTWRRKA